MLNASDRVYIALSLDSIDAESMEYGDSQFLAYVIIKPDDRISEKLIVINYCQLCLHSI